MHDTITERDEQDPEVTKRAEEIVSGGSDASTVPERPPIGPKAADSETYELTAAADHAMVQKYRPAFLARGGEHIVYEIPGREDVVVKVDTESMRKLQRMSALLDAPPGSIDPESIPGVEAFIREHRERYARLKEAFGRDKVLGQKEFFAKVPVTEPIVRAIHGGTPPKGALETDEAWAIVRVQRRAGELGDPTHANVTLGYAEKRGVEPDTYRKATDALVHGDGTLRWDMVVEMFPKKFALMFMNAERDPGLTETLKEFATKAMAYSAQTGEILDLAGQDNVTVFRKDGAWTYRLVDALYPQGPDSEGRGTLVVARDAAAKLVDGERLTTFERTALLNAVNYARGINALAAVTGSKERIRIFPEGKGEDIDLQKELSSLFPSDEAGLEAAE